ncbi:MAG: alpha/beta fold hydrolase [Methylococcaceae bacterium]|nr:alpha/beta fold hydrolase [Methylococcaceae bacterium]
MDIKNVYDDLKDIDVKTYDWSINIIRSLTKMLKVNMKLHADQQVLQGDIFLCNHFSRFETFIPQFLIYEETGAYCCAIASAEFFTNDTVFATYLNNIGVIPHDHHQLFANLARQVFLGRKVIIFPEGGMVKDHRVIDKQGKYSIYSRIAGERRKQHTGAAVLAQGIEAFKATIRNAYSNKDIDRLMQWKQEMKLDSLDQLLATALKPTLIVPSNITFYPIRSSDNLLLKGVELFADGLTLRHTEELLVEGNIILKDTDMDLRMGEPVDPHDVWHWWNKYLLTMVSSEFKSLDEVFSLYVSPKNWKQKLLGYYFRKNAKATRNQYMEEIYTNVTINLSHLASTLIMYCMQRGQHQVNKHCFYKTLYVAIKELQNNKKINLHRSLLNPDEYNDLLEGESKRFEHFICVAEASGLIVSYHDNYQFSPKLCEEYNFDTIRMENLIAVYNNEAEPIKVVRDALIKAVKKCEKVTKEQLAEWAFNDEIISLAWDIKRFSKSRYEDINQRETFKENPEPFLLKPKKNNGIGIILIHGLLASPAELRGYAVELLTQGYTVLAVRLKGHGTSPYDLRTRTYEDWYRSVLRGVKILRVYCESIVVIGFSTGGGLALKLAAENGDKVIAVVAVAVPLKFVDKSFAFIPLLHGTNRLVKWVSSIEGVKPFVENNPEHKTINYSNVPVKSLYELRRLMENIEEKVVDIKIPTLLVHADNDPVVDIESAHIILKKLGAEYKKVVTIHSDRHGFLMENIGGAWEHINSFLENKVLPQVLDGKEISN